MTDGIYTLANDVVFDQLVALLNSIAANMGDVPVCVIPYDDRLDRVRTEISSRPQVMLLEDPALLAPWEAFATQVWQANPTVMQIWASEGVKGVYRLGMHRRFYGFDPGAPFDRFVYLDADTLLLQSLDPIFSYLQQHDFVVYDFQYKDPLHVFNLESPQLLKVFEPKRIETEIFCAGMFASKKGVFTTAELEFLLTQLQAGEADLLRRQSPDQSVLNYMVMRSKKSVFNLALQLPKSQTTGNAVTSPHFEQRGTGMYDHDKPLTYLHYIGLSSQLFQKLCQGENIGFPYREIFLHYRYLHQPEKRPQFKTKPKPYNAPPSLATKVLQKLGFTSQK